MNERELYPSAPLVSVAFELRHPEDDLNALQRSQVKKLLGEYLPVVRSQQNHMQTFEFGPTGPTQLVTSEDIPKYFNRATTMAATLTKTSTIVETSQYPGWERFREIILAVVNARHQVSEIDAVERVGLRYIDEVRIPGDQSPNWRRYLNKSLLGPDASNGAGLALSQWQGQAMYGPEDGRSFMLRYMSGVGLATDPNGELKRKNPQYPGPFFLLDFDSFWIPEYEVPSFSSVDLEVTADMLHAPVRAAFEQSVTDQLRNEVFRK